ncbi:MAG: hypothetical protein RR150_08360 [Clostridia bacterium]
MDPKDENRAKDFTLPAKREAQHGIPILLLNLQLFAKVSMQDIEDENNKPVFSSLDVNDQEGGEEGDSSSDETEDAEDVLEDPLFIPRLAVTDRNMPQSAIGEAVVLNLDGELYSVAVDDEGAVTETQVKLGADHLEDGSITGMKLEEGTITSRELDMEEIFADSALISQIVAANIDAQGLFENEDFLQRLAARTVARAGDVMEGALTLPGNPTQALNAVPKQYVDSAIQAAIENAWAQNY